MTAPANAPSAPTPPAAPLSEWLQVMTDEVSRKREMEAAAAAEAPRRDQSPAAK